MQKLTIYGLSDPRDPKVIRYVGKTKTPLARHLQHCAELGFTPKCKWVDSMRQIGILPQMTILERGVSQFDSNERERYWIKECGKSVTLVNQYENKLADLSEAMIPDPPVVAEPEPEQAKPLGAAVADTEREVIVKELELNRWNIARTSKVLGVSRPTLYAKMHNYGILKKKETKLSATRKAIPSTAEWLASL